MSQTVSKEASKLRKLLTELFQIDDASSLDFGIYRILAQRKDEMRRFLDELMQGIPARLGQEAGDDRAKAQAELDRLVESRLKDGDELEDIHNSRAYKDRLAKLNATVDPQELARDVFRDLYAFFARYWDEGDFMAVPRYDRDTYAIPYDGSEVTLHWANRDQYYVKSTVFFNDMTVRDAAWPGTLRFELAAAVTDRDNAKGADANKRRFTLADEDQPIQVQGKNLVVRLRYGPVAAGDGADEGDDEAPKKGRVSRQDTLDEENANRILELAPAEWKRVLERPHTDSEQPEILRRLRRYTRGNTADFFIHKNLRKFLRRELDFFIKNEVFDLDNIDRASVSTLENKLKRVRALRGLAHDLIDWLHQIEDFQRRLFLKKKFVLRTDWAVTLDRVPRELWPEIAASQRQIERWKELFHIHDTGGDLFTSALHGEAFGISLFERHMHLPVETAMLTDSLASRVMEGVSARGWLDEVTGGTLIRADNLQALNFLDGRFRGEIDCVYIDPPYNASTSEILYKNTFKHSAWLTFMDARLACSRLLARPESTHIVAIDENEHDRLGLLMEERFADRNHTSVSVIHNPRGIQGKGFSMCHEAALFVTPTGVELPLRLLDETKEKPLMKTGTVSSRIEGRTMFYPIYVKDGRVTRLGEVPPDSFHPGMKQTTTSDGEIEVWPIDSDGGERKWRYKASSLLPLLDAVSARPGRDGRQTVYLAKDAEAYRSVWTDSRYNAAEYGSTLVENVLGAKALFSFPKSLHTVVDCLRVGLLNGEGTVLDYFGGSGTTGHAVLSLNREDKRQREFILAEMGDHFDTVLVPRILKATYSKDWKEGKPVDRKGLSALYKILRLESYDDTLENITLDRPDERQEALFNGGSTTGAGRDYLLRYSLRMEAGRSLLDKDRFATPFDYKIRALVTRRDEQGNAWSAVDETPVDLVETFNYLLGLRVKAVQPLGRGGDMRRARYIEGVRRNSQGEWAVKVVVIWRDCTQVDDAALDDLFARAQFTEPTPEGRRIIADYDEVYVNGDNRLPNQRLEGERWKVTLIEEEFHRLMFDVPEEE